MHTGLVITPIYLRLCVVNSRHGNTFSLFYFPGNGNNSKLFRFFALTSDFGATNSHFVRNNENLTLTTRPFRFNVRAAEDVI